LEQVTEVSRAKTYFTASEELDTLVAPTLDELSTFKELIAASKELDVPSSEELVASSVGKLEDDSVKAASLELDSVASADESGFAA
jgi:hypothetical protein